METWGTSVDLPLHQDRRGVLGVVENKDLPFEIKRVFWITAMRGKRGGHAHRDTYQAIIVVEGAVAFYIEDQPLRMILPGKMLLIPPGVTVSFEAITHDSVLLVLASKEYDPHDYIFTDVRPVQ